MTCTYLQARIKELEEELDLERSARNKVTTLFITYLDNLSTAHQLCLMAQYYYFFKRRTSPGCSRKLAN